MPRVPTVREVVPGAFVNIVLKADQRTGRTVSGSIADVLTRGNHPRGIKVRLTDGRVGRVQSMTTGSDGASPNQHGVGLPPAPRGTTSERSELPSQVVGLDAYITNGRPRGNWKGARQRETEPEFSPRDTAQVGVVTCPVCGNFEGDEMAVNHHVASHFAD
ncbi:hypothetical protein BO71DRAFT_254450 [Aspergillus ellipticus CBS 707.79]|uniref:UBZ4-type domain-containing protein n=1 Tax=Aspergillus ellipticus CBS 707.79 TaxID=1448320 RepID=A0A319DZC6_9EURO|nr:hypothetical protein BO71DRAFT_254450 [Aspergillus ellipticus CBS 707.79]